MIELSSLSYPNQGTMQFMLRIATLSLLAIATPAIAHPHVWVQMQSGVVVNSRGLIEGVDVKWTFDDAYTQTATEGLDANGDGVFSSEELRPLTKENIESLKEFEYFTVMRLKGERLPIAPVTESGQVFESGKLTLFFRVPLQKPVDPKTGEFTVKVYDPEFFIAFDYGGDEAAGVDGTLPKGCKLELKPLQTDEEMEQTRTMLSTKGTDWKPDTEEDFGAMFAQPVVVTCAS
jgi:ABC-type uncharacterized transport system substrate-binding protein